MPLLVIHLPKHKDASTVIDPPRQPRPFPRPPGVVVKVFELAAACFQKLVCSVLGLCILGEDTDGRVRRWGGRGPGLLSHL